MKELPSLSELVKGTTASFIYYRDGELWYQVGYSSKDPNDAIFRFFDFPVPIQEEDTDASGKRVKKIVVAEFGRNMKAITLMRWIRKELENQEKIRVERQNYLTCFRQIPDSWKVPE